MQLGVFIMPAHPLDKDWCRSLGEEGDAFIHDDRGDASHPDRGARNR